MTLEIVVKEEGRVQIRMNARTLFDLTEEEAVELKLALEQAVAAERPPFHTAVEIA